MDIGSFVLDADGVRWSLDLGSEGYHGIESRGMNLWGRNQDSDRWTIFRQSNAGHSTLVIDGKLQRAAGHGTIVSFSGNSAFAHTVVDMDPVYEGQARTTRRGVALLPSREVLIQDELTGLEPGSRVRWGMITRGTLGQSADSTMLLRQRNRQLSLCCLTPDSTWQVIDVSRPMNEWDSPNRDTRMVAFECVAPDNGKLTLAVLATPGTCRQSVKETLTISPLDSWSERSEVARENGQ